MRLFVALEIPAKVRQELASMIANLREAARQSSRNGPKWVHAENLHLTLKFIGEVADDKAAAICGALASVPQGEPIELEFRGLGFFPNERKPRVLWAGIEGSPRLQLLAEDVENALERIGIPREQRPFYPHLTLARFEPAGLDAKLSEAITQNACRVFGSMRAREFRLIESKLKPSGAEYTTVQTFPFAEAEA
jgi:RNA 2',3'-cyclic 3'-phosphodiesterase